VLEGEENALRALYELIKRDARHQYLIAYADKPIAQRTFTEWSMAFQPGSPQQAAALTGYLGPTDVALEIESLPAVEKNVFDILRSFTLP
jgi:hypothetical protein